MRLFRAFTIDMLRRIYSLAAALLLSSSLCPAQTISTPVVNVTGKVVADPYYRIPFVVLSPSPYQVFQRSGTTGRIRIAGNITGTATAVEARFKGGSWSQISSAVVGPFSGELTNQPQGQGTLEIRPVNFP